MLGLMRYLIHSMTTTALVLSVAIGTACTKSKPEAPRAIEPREVAGMLNNGFAVVVDVREEKERTEVIDKAEWLATSKIDSDPKAWDDFTAHLPKDKTIVFHCVGGSRAKDAAEKLAAQGYKTAYFSGLDAWKAAGLPVKKP